MILSPLIMTQIFALFTSGAGPIYLPGALFLVSMLLIASCAAVFLIPPRQAAPKA